MHVSLNEQIPPKAHRGCNFFFFRGGGGFGGFGVGFFFFFFWKEKSVVSRLSRINYEIGGRRCSASHVR